MPSAGAEAAWDGSVLHLHVHPPALGDAAVRPGSSKHEENR